MAIVSPSILAAKREDLVHEIQKVEAAGATYIHLDVMDGRFVPATTFGAALIGEISHVHHMVNDVHLMVANPREMALACLKAGADLVTFHVEACASEKEIHEILALIHARGKKAGLSLKPATPVSALLPFWKEIDLCLVMSVEPGKGGQKFMDSALERLSYFASLNEKEGTHVLLEVDGGINAETAPLAVNAGADILVAGSYIYGHEDYASRMKGLLAL